MNASAFPDGLESDWLVPFRAVELELRVGATSIPFWVIVPMFSVVAGAGAVVLAAK